MGLGRKSRWWRTPRGGKYDSAPAPHAYVRVDALPRLRCGRCAICGNAEEKIDKYFDNARLVAGDEKCAEHRGQKSRDERGSEISAPDRQAFAGLGNAEDGDLRYERDQEETKPPAAVREVSPGCSRTSKNRKREQGQDREWNVTYRENEERVSGHPERR
jgi:hypothetical protein